MKPTCLPISEIEARLRAAGVSPTAQRIAICQYVLCDAEHPTADEVKQWVDGNFPKISMATIYNTLNTLTRVGLLTEIHIAGQEVARYDCNTDRHYHFVDDATGAIIDLAPEVVDIRMQLGSGFTVRHTDVVIRGTLNSAEA
ncbi:MAG: transcriptional repressor [Candidatus Sericytochromatia bacterium]|nr:transcriptional repressor [Candidatus Sericytochromatia bacterium]